MENKKLYLITIGIIIVLGIIGFFILKSQYDTSDFSVEEENGVKITNIKSSKKNTIEKDNIEAKNIKVINNSGDVKVETTLKNNTDETIEGFFIQIDLLDENGNTITSIAENSNEKIEANSEITIINYVAGMTNAESITNAKIVSIEKNNVKTTITDAFDEMEKMQ